MNQVYLIQNFRQNEHTAKEKKKRHRSTARIWRKIKEFESNEEAESFLQNEDMWKKASKKRNLDGERVEFRCKYGKYREKECPAAIYLFYHAFDEKVSLFSTDTAHCHYESRIPFRGIDNTSKEVIIWLYKNGIENPEAIIAELKKENLPEPTKIQLTVFLKRLREKKYKSSSENELVEWSEECKLIPVETSQEDEMNIDLKVEDPLELETINLNIENTQTTPSVIRTPSPVGDAKKQTYTMVEEENIVNNIQKNDCSCKDEHEFDYFGKSIAVQLKKMPLDRALICQEKLQAVLKEERLYQLKNNLPLPPCSIFTESES